MAAITTRVDTANAASARTDARGGRGAIRALDGVRGLAIALVVWCHLDQQTVTRSGPLAFAQSAVSLWPWLHDVAQLAGPAGVMLFFVLSGFLLFTPYARALLCAVPWPSTRIFYLRRIRRILPAYTLVLVVILGARAGITATQHAPIGLSLGVVLADVTLLYNHSHAAYDPLGRWDGPLWSLAVEWQFYLLLPLLAAGLHRWTSGRPRRMVGALVALIAAGLLIRGLAAWMHYTLGLADPLNASGVLGILSALLYGMRGIYIEVFSLGMLASVAYVWYLQGVREAPAQHAMVARRLLMGSFALALCVLVWAAVAGRFSPGDGTQLYWQDARSNGWLAPGFVVGSDFTFALAAFALVVGVLCLLSARRSIVVWCFETRPLVWLGLISYSLYLWHWPLMMIATSIAAPALVWAIIVMAALIGWSAAGYRLVERPFLGYRAAHGMSWLRC